MLRRETIPNRHFERDALIKFTTSDDNDPKQISLAEFNTEPIINH